MYTKESLENLRSRIDLAEVLSSHIELKRSGSSYKACCPFHQEKTPSFVVQQNDTHYHCYGCGAHGDAIAFLMLHLKLSFTEAVESLANRFGVRLDLVEKQDFTTGINKTELKNCLEKASLFYHFFLLQTEIGQKALSYLYSRGIDLDFIKLFQLGLSPPSPGIFSAFMKKSGFSEEILEKTGLLHNSGREFFTERIMFPIREATGGVIGFSGRKFLESTFGGKYVNTPETYLFKKSKVLFGIDFCRRRIAKLRKAIIVEGQIDALRLIKEGLNFTVASQGTAFGEDHAKELIKLGVDQVFLCFDGDDAGQAATEKVGDIFQKNSVEVSVVPIPKSKDPDSLMLDLGPQEFLKLLKKSKSYLNFLYDYLSKSINTNSPSGKNELVEIISSRVRKWEHPVMVYESLLKLAKLANIPEATLDINKHRIYPVLIQNKGNIDTKKNIDPDKILESDLIRWLFLLGESIPKIVQIIKQNLSENLLVNKNCQRLMRFYLEEHSNQRPLDLLSLNSRLESPEDNNFLSEILEKKINLDRAEKCVIETVEKILHRRWMEQREQIKAEIHSGKYSDEEAMDLLKKFDELKKNPPVLIFS